MSTDSGTVLTCTDTACGCRVQVLAPCPHGDAYTCACGHPLTAEGREPIPPTPGA